MSTKVAPAVDANDADHDEITIFITGAALEAVDLGTLQKAGIR